MKGLQAQLKVAAVQDESPMAADAQESLWSALVDGELGEAEAARLLTESSRERAFTAAWELYHVAGDALRGEPAVSADFSRKFAARLADEPTVLAPQAGATRRRALSAAASLTAFALVGWLGWQLQGTDSPALNLAQAPAGAGVASAEVSPYLAAHQEYAPTFAGGAMIIPAATTLVESGR